MLGLSFDTEILTMDAHSEFVAGGLMTLRCSVKVGDLVQVNKYCDAGGLWRKTGIVIGRKRAYEPGKPPYVRVLISTREHLFDYCALDIINESR
jgi:hypothetical protein|tara:strand:- start:26 stop:307 length:282 start_codon:yes stop_codon:yes gene_type:complete